LLALFQYGPFAILGLLGGVVADRLDQRHLIIGTQTAFMLTATALATLTLAGRAALWEVYVTAAITGTVSVLDTPVRQTSHLGTVATVAAGVVWSRQEEYPR
jgi:nitrate/nitrite transporter NarK